MINIDNGVFVREDFKYFLPNDLIAQSPIERRDHSKLMVLNKKTGAIHHDFFYNIADYFEECDLLVLNDSKVFPARIFGENENINGVVEFLLLKRIDKNIWEALAKPGKKAKIGSKFWFGENKLLKAEITFVKNDGNRILRFENGENFFDVLEKVGLMPLPPYIKKKLNDPNKYQTVYAKELGSAAAPTAGFHFTNNLLEKLKKKGINTAFLTLHVGLGTFRPVKENDLYKHKMHAEHYFMKKETAELINSTKNKNKKVVAVGTTSCRTLEAIFKKYGKIIEDNDWTDVFIHNDYKFNVVDALITNFHLPESTLIMLAASFAGYKNIMEAYKKAVENNYKFFSFGDAMLII